MIVKSTEDRLVKWEGGTVAHDDERGSTISTNETVAWWTSVNSATSRATQPAALPDINR